jgi:dihydroorotate dehydrogenase
MYKKIIRPLLFLIPPEEIHHCMVTVLKLGFKIPGLGYLCRSFLEVKDDRLRRNFCGIHFDNPVGFAAGFDKNAEVFNEMKNFGFSFIEIGTVTPRAQPGNPRPRLFRLPADQALINRMGFNNYGAISAATRLKCRKHKIVVGGNIGKNTTTPNDQAVIDYETCFEALYEVVDYLVINVSCPNVANLCELQDKNELLGILDKLNQLRAKHTAYKPVLLKISPDLTFNQLDDIIDIFNLGKVDGVVATNTTTRRENLQTTDNKVKAIGKGGLSGKPVSGTSTEIIRYLSEKTRHTMPIMGVGGIMTPQDALDKIHAGAALIQVYTGFIYQGPGFVKEINQAILKDTE